MDALTIDRELAAITTQTRRLAVWSVVVHVAGAVLLLAVTSQPNLDAATDEVLTEITWAQPETEPVEVATSIAPAAVDEPGVVTAPGPSRPAPPVAVPTSAPAPRALPRESGPLPVAQRLAALRAGDAGQRVVALAGAMPGPRSSWSSVAPRTTTPARELNRAAAAPVATLAALPRARQGVVSAAATSPAAPRPETTVAATREVRPGVQLAGEVSGRRLRDCVVPEYPQWAQREGVEVSVRFYFIVLADGRVKENVRVERTSGFDDFDRLARAALASWRFESLDPGATAEQWGRVEFKYRLKGVS
jgi:TonB family protein